MLLYWHAVICGRDQIHDEDPHVIIL